MAQSRISDLSGEDESLIIRKVMSSAQHAACRFRRRIAGALALRGSVKGAAFSLFAGGAIVLAMRFAGHAPDSGWLTLEVAGGVACAAALTAFAEMRRCPPVETCLAALDAATRAGGLFMIGKLPGAETWQSPSATVPGVAWRDARLTGCLLLGVLFCAVVTALPERVFAREQERRLELTAVVEQASRQVARLEEEHLLPVQAVAALSNELTKLSGAGDASDPARVLEALDHIDGELARVAQEEAETLAARQADMQAAQALVEMLAERMARDALPDQAAAAAQDALSRFLASARLPAAAMSNLLATVHSSGGLSPEVLRELAERLKEAGLLEGRRLAALSELKLVDASLCKGAGGCTNAAACRAALAGLLAEDGAAADAASVLTAMCVTPGRGDVSRGRGDALLTWTDPSTKEGVTFREDVLKPHGGVPGLERTTLEGLSAAAPVVPERASPAEVGALAEARAARGVTPQQAVLPRHREAVKRYFGDAGR
jgi:hypothetical protein